MKFLNYSDELSILSTSREDTLRIGKIFGSEAFGGLLVLLRGTLGAGKTHFVQGIGEALNSGKVKSPTFIIMSEHEGKIPLLHVDLYRLEEQTEIDSLGIEEYLEDGWIAAVEWSEKWKAPQTEEIVVVTIISNGSDEDSRMFKMYAKSKNGKAMLARIAEIMKSEK